MSVKIIVKRRIPEDKKNQAVPLLELMRSMACKQNGYFYGESLRSSVDPEQHIVISTWQSMACWQAWEASKERQLIQARIDALLGTTARYEIYCHLAPVRENTACQGRDGCSPAHPIPGHHLGEPKGASNGYGVCT